MATCKSSIQVFDSGDAVVIKCDLEEHSPDVDHEDHFQLMAWRPLTAGNLAKIPSGSSYLEEAAVR